MSEAIRHPGGAALPRPMGIGEILSTAFQLYQRHWRTLLAIAAVVVPFTLLQYLLSHTVRVTGVATSNGVVVTTSSWRVGLAGLITALAGVVMFLVLTGAITRAVAAEAGAPVPGGRPSHLARLATMTDRGPLREVAALGPDQPGHVLGQHGLEHLQADPHGQGQQPSRAALASSATATVTRSGR